MKGTTDTKNYGHWDISHVRPFAPADWHGFIYRISTPDDRHYMGKKAFRETRTLPALKGQRAKRKVTKESNWRSYTSSQAELKQAIKANPEGYSFEITGLASSKRELTYLEAKALFAEGAIERDDFLNANILGKFFKGNLK